MGMLERIKRRQIEGFKDFVQNMEVSVGQTRQQILLTGILEDPLFMGWVMKNIRNFDDFLDLPSAEIDKVLLAQDQVLSMLAKSVFDYSPERIKGLEPIIPRYMSKLRDELSYLKEVTPGEQEAARNFILKIARKFQTEERIQGFRWFMPPQDIFHPKTYPDGKASIFFETGILAAEGDMLKNKRSGHWVHNYDSGKVLAEGEYSEGAKQGVWTFYYGNGAMKSKGKYHADTKHGVWKEWDRSGNVSETEYKEGVKL